MYVTSIHSFTTTCFGYLYSPMFCYLNVQRAYESFFFYFSRNETFFSADSLHRNRNKIRKLLVCRDGTRRRERFCSRRDPVNGSSLCAGRPQTLKI